MIVSGFTQKSVTMENTQGSALDHSHCITCVSRKCKVSTKNGNSCDVIDCPRGCISRYHGCKDNEHALLCPEEKVACINSGFGCPAMVSRKKLTDHLTICPANIVHCRAEWNRYILEPVQSGEKRPLMLKKVYVDCGQLDTALAMRDHRALVDRHLFPQDIKTPGSVGSKSDFQKPQLPSSDSDVRVDLPHWERWGCSFTQLKKKPDTSGGPASESQSVPDQAGPSNAEGETQSQGSSEGGQARHCSHSQDPDTEEEPLQDGQALRTILSHSLSVESISRCQPKGPNISTLVCAQDMRRGEFPHHHWAVHDRLQSDLGGWMEQRCPLAYLGCPFSFRRLQPNLPGMTVRHSPLLESFGVTAQPPQADFSHQTPLHLLPAFAQTADSPDTAASECNGPEPIEHEHGCVEHEPKPSAASSQNCHSDQVPVSNPSPSSPCTQGSQPAEDYFSSLLDSVSLEEDGKAYQEPHPRESLSENGQGSAGLTTSSVSGQATQAFRFSQEDHQVSSTENTAFTSQNSFEEDGNIRTTSSASPPTHQHHHHPPGDSNCNNLLPTTSKKPQSFSSSSVEEGRKQTVIYTGISANSCVRIDTRWITDHNSLSLDGSADRSQPQLQLSDLPSEIVCYISQFLDSFSLYSLSLVSHGMRDLCCTLLQDRGMVALMWAKQPPPHPSSSPRVEGNNPTAAAGPSPNWSIVGKRWSFSTCFDPVTSWQFTGHNPISDHLSSCPYNQDRLRHSEAFSIIPDKTSEDG